MDGTSKGASRELKLEPLTAQGALPFSSAFLAEGVTLDPETEREREARLEAFMREMQTRLASGDTQGVLGCTFTRLLELERENERLAWRLLRALRHRFGRATEKLSKEELAELVRALGGDEANAALPEPEVPTPEPPCETSNEPGEATPSPPDKPKKKRTRTDRTRVAESVERVVHPEVRVSGDERTCATCGHEKTTTGFVEHQRIEYVPAKIVVHIERREKCACPRCRAEVSVGERAPDAWTRRIGPSLLAKLIADKCAYAMPLHRQCQELERMGLHLPEKTVDTCWAYALDALSAVALATRAEVLGAQVVGVDDSHLKTLDKGKKKGTFRGHLWCFVGTDAGPGSEECVAYGYTASWKAEEIRDWFAAIDGDVQCDGYAGYAAETEDEDSATFVAVPNERRLGCGMHIRRKFHEAWLGKDKRAAVPLKVFADLYVLEAECKARGLDAEARAKERRARSIPILDAFDAWVDEMHPKLLPKSPLRAATSYAIGQRPFFRRCFEDGRFEIDNGRVERRLRLF